MEIAVHEDGNKVSWGAKVLPAPAPPISIPASLMASRICPVRSSISARQSAQSPLPVLPANSRFSLGL